MAGEEGEEGAAGSGEAGAGGAGDSGDPKEQARRQYEAHLQAARDLVKADPRMAAQIIKEWITSDE